MERKTIFDFTDRNAKYFFAFYLISVVLIIFYFLKYNFQYNMPEYNWILGTLLGLILIAPLYYAKTGKIFQAQLILFTLVIFTLTFFIYTAGGMDAPGIFWLSAIPITGGMLLGKRGVIYGAFLFVLAIGVYVTTARFFDVPNVILKLGVYKEEKIFNFFAFSIYSVLTTAYFISNEESNRRKMRKQKDQIENLFRVLIHDVATPISVINMRAQSLMRQVQDEKILKSLVQIHKSSTSLVSMLEGMRQLKAINDGKVKLKLASLTVLGCIQKAIEGVADRAEEKGVRLAVGPIDPGLEILADEMIVSSVVFGNVLNNAIKFSQPGGTVEARVLLRAAEIVVEFQDFGVGIPPEILEGLFQLDLPTSRAGTQGEKGTGYGVILVKEFMKFLGGRLEIDSCTEASADRPQGTTVRLIFRDANPKCVLKKGSLW